MENKTILLIVISSLMLFSCASSRQWVEKPESERAAGWVSFYTSYISGGYEDELRLKITKIEKTGEDRTYENYDSWSVYGDFRVLCSPGTHSFLVSHKNYRERITVDVYENEVTFVSYRRRYLNETTFDSFNGETTISSYRIQPSSGTQHIAADWNYDDIDILSLLDNTDWGVRHYTLSRLIKDRPHIENAIRNGVRECAVYDAVSRVRVYARRVLKAYGEKLPPEPVVLEGFEDNYGRWPEGDFPDSGTVCFITDSGYLFQNNEKNDRWVMNHFPGFDVHRKNCRVSLEGYWVDGDDSTPFGVCVGESDEDFLIFAISANGGAAAWQYSGGNWQQQISWDQSAAETIAGEGMIRIEVEIKGKNCTFLVNNVEIGTVDSDLVFGKAGMFVSGPQTILFHSLLIFGAERF